MVRYVAGDDADIDAVSPQFIGQIQQPFVGQFSHPIFKRVDFRDNKIHPRADQAVVSRTTKKLYKNVFDQLKHGQSIADRSTICNKQ